MSAPPPSILRHKALGSPFVQFVSSSSAWGSAHGCTLQFVHVVAPPPFLCVSFTVSDLSLTLGLHHAAISGSSSDPALNGNPLAKSVPPPLHGASRNGVAPRRVSHSLLLQGMGVQFWGYHFSFSFSSSSILAHKEKRSCPFPSICFFFFFSF